MVVITDFDIFHFFKFSIISQRIITFAMRSHEIKRFYLVTYKRKLVGNLRKISTITIVYNPIANIM